MSCLFCDSNFHVSHFCDKYVTNESRRDRATSKKCCPNCFLKSESWCKKCEYRKNCYVCFSRYHETVFCPNVMKEPRMFPPRIDEDLLPRFYEFLNFDEKWSLISTFPNLSNLVILKPIRVSHKQEIFVPFSYSNFDVITVDKICLYNGAFSFGDNYAVNIDRVLPLNPPIFYIRHVEIHGLNISSQEFLLLLSSRTSNLICKMTKIFPILTFSEILKKAPYLMDIDLFNTNIGLTNSWPNDVLNLHKSDHFNTIKLTFNELNVNPESLISLLKKSTKPCIITLDFFLRFDENLNKNIKEAKNEMLKYFVPTERHESYCLTIQVIIFHNIKETYQVVEYYTLKEDCMAE